MNTEGMNQEGYDPADEFNEDGQPDIEDIEGAEPEEGDDGLFEHHRIVIDKKQGLVRIDRFLTDRLANASRNRIQNAIDSGFVRVNGQPTKVSYKVKPNDVISVSMPHPPHSDEIKPENIPLNIVYEDAELLVLNKPAGMVVHPAYGNWEGTLVNALVYHFQHLPTGRNGEIRPGLVHRIDKDTSGLMVIAKTEEAMTHLAKQFFFHSIERTYNALVWGVPAEPKGTINVHLGRHPKDRKVTAPFPDGSQGKHAITHYELLEDLRYVSLVKCNLETGRTHQIRAHMKYLGHPLFNDAMYGGDRILRGTVFSKYKSFVDNAFALCPRQALHARSLGFNHPRTGQWMQFDSPLPDDMAAVIAKWQGYVNQE